ncbi:MAG: hypothetical protein ACR2HX_19490 [Pyrinomonadaceae bacterium]
MPDLLYPRIALVAYALGLVLTVVFNIFNGRSRYGLPVSSGHKTGWASILYLRGLLLYASIAVLTYWAVQTNGYAMGILAGLGALIFKSMVNRMSWRMF